MMAFRIENFAGGKILKLFDDAKLSKTVGLLLSLSFDKHDADCLIEDLTVMIQEYVSHEATVE